jgi:hypothetical protein
MQPQQKKFSLLWKLAGLAFLAVLISGIFLILPNPVPRLSNEGVPPPWASVKTTLMDLEPSWHQVCLLISTGQVLQAEQLLNREHRPMWSAAVAHYPRQGMPNGLSLTQWIQFREQEVTALLHQDFSQAVFRVASGDLALDQLEDWLAEREDPYLLQTLEEAWDKLIQDRISAATNWYRVVFQNPDETLMASASLETLVRKAARKPDFVKLVFGPAISDEEQAATYNTLLVTGQVQTATFTTEINNSFKEQTWTPPPMVIGSSWYPRELRKEHATTWSNLDEIHSWLKPPTKISRNLEEKIQKSYNQRIQNGVRQGFLQWPALEPKLPPAE